jgi:competence protein ComEA
VFTDWRFTMIRNIAIAAFAALAFAFNALAAVEANQASQADLETVKGIGPGLSTKIIDARKTGPFKDWTDMVDRVPGVGPGNAARFSQAGLTVGGTPYAMDAAAPSANAVKTVKADKAAVAAPAKADKAVK